LGALVSQIPFIDLEFIDFFAVLVISILLCFGLGSLRAGLYLLTVKMTKIR